MPRHDRHRNRERAGRFRKVRHKRARPFLSGAGGQDKDSDIGILVDQLDDLFGRIAFADHPVRCDAGDFFCARREFVERRISRFVRR